LNALYALIEGLLQVQSTLAGRPIHRPLRDWAVSPDALGWILADLHERQSAKVIEFGSGQSTFVIASVLKQRGIGGLLTVEHDAAYADTVKTQLAAWGLADTVEFQILPLEDTAARNAEPACQSYPVHKLPNTLVDVAIVDGPPMSSGMFTRYAPLKWAIDHLATGGTAYLDDSKRPSEQAVLSRLQLEVPTLQRKDLNAEKGLAMLKRT